MVSGEGCRHLRGGCPNRLPSADTRWGTTEETSTVRHSPGYAIRWGAGLRASGRRLEGPRGPISDWNGSTLPALFTPATTAQHPHRSRVRRHRRAL
jgi:hypothetical protein